MRQLAFTLLLAAPPRRTSPAAAIWTVALAGLVCDLLLYEFPLAAAIAARLLAHDLVRALAAVQAPLSSAASEARRVRAHLRAASARKPAHPELAPLLLDVCLASQAGGGVERHG